MEVIPPRRFRRRPPTRQKVEYAIAVRLERARPGYPILLRSLPRPADPAILLRIVGRCRPAQIGIVQIRLRLLRRFAVATRGKLLRRAFPRRGKKPQPVTLDRAAEAFPGVAKLFERSDAVWIDVARDQLRRDVLRSELRARVGDRRNPGKLIAAVLRDHVDLHASAVAVGPDTAGFDDHFLDVELVVDEDTLCGVRELLVHAVDVRLRLWTAMNAVTRLRPVACAADATVELLRERGSWNDIRQDREPARTRQRFDGGLFELCLRTRALDVDNGSFT